eukprot:6163662-Prymnesium_polylepis.1
MPYWGWDGDARACSSAACALVSASLCAAKLATIGRIRSYCAATRLLAASCTLRLSRSARTAASSAASSAMAAACGGVRVAVRVAVACGLR